MGPESGAPAAVDFPPPIPPPRPASTEPVVVESAGARRRRPWHVVVAALALGLLGYAIWLASHRGGQRGAIIADRPDAVRIDSLDEELVDEEGDDDEDLDDEVEPNVELVEPHAPPPLSTPDVVAPPPLPRPESAPVDRVNATPAPLPAPRSTTFDEFPKAVDLPAKYGEGGPTLAGTPLGVVHLPPQSRLELDLAGGDVAFQVRPRRSADVDPASRRPPKVEIEGVPTFSLVPAPAPATNQWNVQVTPSAVTVGQFELDPASGELRFRWTLASLEESASPYLINCVLRLRAGPHERHAVCLRKPILAAPARLGLGEAAASTYAIPHAPPVAIQKVEFRDVHGGLPRYASAGTRDLRAVDDTVELMFGDGSPLVERLRIDQPGDLRVRSRGYLNLPTWPEPQPLSDEALARAEREFAATRADLKQERAGARSEGKKGAKKRVREIDRKLRLLAQTESQVAWARKMRDAHGAESTIDLRVYHDAGGYEVELLKSF